MLATTQCLCPTSWWEWQDDGSAHCMKCGAKWRPASSPPTPEPGAPTPDEGVQCIRCGRWHTGFDNSDAPVAYCEDCTDDDDGSAAALPPEIVTALDEIRTLAEKARDAELAARAIAEAEGLNFTARAYHEAQSVANDANMRLRDALTWERVLALTAAITRALHDARAGETMDMNVGGPFPEDFEAAQRSLPAGYTIVSVDSARKIRALRDADDELELAWVIIANAGGGDWTRESPEWQEAAAKWRDRVMLGLSARLAARTPPEPTGAP